MVPYFLENHRVEKVGKKTQNRFDGFFLEWLGWLDCCFTSKAGRSESEDPKTWQGRYSRTNWTESHVGPCYFGPTQNGGVLGSLWVHNARVQKDE